MKEATLEVEGRVVLRFLRAHGFRNIQNVVQKLKRKMKFNYDFVEIMACPSGMFMGVACFLKYVYGCGLLLKVCLWAWVAS